MNYEEEKRMIQIFNVSQDGKAAEKRLRMLDFELQKLDYDEAGVEPGKEHEFNLEGE